LQFAYVKLGWQRKWLFCCSTDAQSAKQLISALRHRRSQGNIEPVVAQKLSPVRSFRISYFKSGSSWHSVLSLHSFLWKFSYNSNGNAKWPTQKLHFCLFCVFIVIIKRIIWASYSRCCCWFI